MYKITLLDYLLLPFFLGLIYFIALRIRNKRYPPKHPWRKYFLAGLTVKIAGALLNGMIHCYYYGNGGDSFGYFSQFSVLNAALDDSFINWVKLLFHIPDFYDPEFYRYTSHSMYPDTPSYTVSAIGAFLGFFAFNTYLPTAVLFTAISYTGIWAMFQTFARLYPHLAKQIAIAVLFIPTVVFWGSGIYKDTICLFGLGWLVYCAFQFMVQKRFRLPTILIALLSFVLIAKIKLYILLALLPAIFIWILFNYLQTIRQKAVRQLAKVFISLVVLGLSALLMSVFSEELGIYSLDKLAYSAEDMRNWVYSVSVLEEGSAYTLGEIDPSFQGMLIKFPQAVNVTLFRPYLWESRKVIVLFSAVESLLFLILTLRVLVSVGIRKFWRAISEDPTVQFCLIFSLIFAFAVGISTYNFGSLSRYKIPCLPFYFLALILIFYRYKPASKKLLPPFF